MEFLHSQESLTAIQWILRAIVAYIFLLFATKIMGQRFISQLRLIDFVMALVLGNIIAHPLSDEHLGLKGSTITTSVLVLMYLISVILVMKYQWLRNLAHGEPFPLIKDNQILFNNLKKARISIDILLSEMRKQQISDIQHVALALWESEGTISFFLKPAQQNVTKEDMGIPVNSFIFPKTIIKEGILDTEALKEIGKDEAWLQSKLRDIYTGELGNILLAIIDGKERLKLFYYK